jgi:hypothetical protein
LRTYIRAILVLVIVLGPLQWATAQEAEAQEIAYYTLGQQSLSISAGMFIPLFFQSFTGQVSSTNLSLGGVGSFQWGAHLDNNWLIGAEVGGMFAKSAYENLMVILPITIKASYIFHIYPFEIPLFLGTGISILKYESESDINFMLKPGFSVLWKYSSSWAFGMNVTYWWILQPWKTDPDMSRMGNFLEITPTAQYSF